MRFFILIFLLNLSTLIKADTLQCGFDGLPTFSFDTGRVQRSDHADGPQYTEAEGAGVYVHCGFVWNSGEEQGDPYCSFSASEAKNGELGAIVFSKDSTKVHVAVPRKTAPPILFGCQK